MKDLRSRWGKNPTYLCWHDEQDLRNSLSKQVAQVPILEPAPKIQPHGHPRALPHQGLVIKSETERLIEQVYADASEITKPTTLCHFL